MTRDLRPTNSNRRKFLRDIAAAGGLAAVAGTAGSVTAASATEPKPRADTPTGYRVTAHIAKYYDKARF